MSPQLNYVASGIVLCTFPVSFHRHIPKIFVQNSSNLVEPVILGSFEMSPGSFRICFITDKKYYVT